jgi:prophage DNA circulation protein
MTTNPTPEALAAEYRSSMSREVLHAWATDVQATIRTLSAELAAAIESNTALMVEAGTLHSMGVADLNKIQALTAERDSLRAEVERLRGAITHFCVGQKRAVDEWKAQPHIKPLFDIASAPPVAEGVR